MVKFPLVWPSGRNGLFIGNTRAILDYPNALQILVDDFVRVLIVDDTKDGRNAASICSSHSSFMRHLLFPVSSCLSEKETNHFTEAVLPWMQEGMQSDLPLLIVSPDAVNRAPAFAMTFIAWQLLRDPDLADEDWNGIFGVGVLEVVTHACSFAAPRPNLLASLLESIGRTLPNNYLEVYEKILKHR